MKLSHVIILATSILLGFSALAGVHLNLNRYHYSNLPIDGRIARVDRFYGTVEVYDKDRGWVDVRYK